MGEVKSGRSKAGTSRETGLAASCYGHLAESEHGVGKSRGGAIVWPVGL